MSRNQVASGALAASGRASLTPVQQQALEGFDVNRPYGESLGRDPSVFTDGVMTPLRPLEIRGIDTPDEETGRPPMRRWQYPVAWNLNMGQPGSEGLKLAAFGTLRQLGEQFSVARTCIERRVSEICRLKWNIVPTTDAELKMHGDEQLREEWQGRYLELRNFFQHPDADRDKYPSFAAWMSALLEDVCVIDAVGIHLQRPTVKGKGVLGSDLGHLNLVDGSTLRPMLSLSGATPPAPNVAYQQFMWGVPRVDLLSVITEQDLEVLEEPIRTYTNDQLIYLRKKTRTATPYGFSMVEQALLPISIGLARQQWQWDYYQEGSVPAQFITAGPDISTPQQVRQLQDALNAMAGDVGAKHRIVVLPPGSVAKEQKPVDLANQFDQWIVSQTAMAFMYSNLDLGIVPNVTSTPTSVNIKEMQASQSDPKAHERLEDLAVWLKQSLFDRIIRDVLKQKDMEWSWGITEQGESIDLKIQRHKDQIGYAMESVDEARVDLGKAPWGIPESSVPLWATASGPLPLTTITSETGEQDVRPWSAPGNAKPTDSELTTPAHNATGGDNAKPPPSAKPPLKPASDPTKPTPSAVKAELGVLRRYLTKGNDPAAFYSGVLSQNALAAAVVMLGAGHSIPAAIEAAQYVSDHDLEFAEVADGA